MNKNLLKGKTNTLQNTNYKRLPLQGTVKKDVNGYRKIKIIYLHKNHIS